jgi:hypothetical protein
MLEKTACGQLSTGFSTFSTGKACGLLGESGVKHAGACWELKKKSNRNLFRQIAGICRLKYN